MAWLSVASHRNSMDPAALSTQMVRLVYWPHERVVDVAAHWLGRLLRRYDPWLVPIVDTSPRLAAATLIVLLSLPVSCLYVWVAAGVVGRLRRRESN